jgi:hypothetical protein
VLFLEHLSTVIWNKQFWLTTIAMKMEMDMNYENECLWIPRKHKCRSLKSEYFMCSTAILLSFGTEMRRSLKELCRWDAVKDATDAIQDLLQDEKRIVPEQFTIPELLNAPLFLLHDRLQLFLQLPVSSTLRN